MKEKKENILLKLFLSFFKIGAFTFGGGYAMIALLENEFVANKKWLTKDEFLDMVAIAESTPGPVAINSATYIGYKLTGFLGSLISTVAVALPSLIIIYIISLFFNAFMEFKYVAYAFTGIRVCVVYLIASAGIKMFKGLKKTPLTLTVFTLTLITFIAFSLFAVNFSSIYFILIGGLIGIFTTCIFKCKKEVSKE
ncbi:MAG: chromate transporter [Lachnospiraceae bacterium]|nr:chromate transporter [Lachnospiraceae bacterium]